jgi:hypothetical protein
MTGLALVKRGSPGLREWLKGHFANAGRPM